MYNYTLPAVILLFLLCGCQTEPHLTLRNDLALDRENAPVVISRTDYEARFGKGKPGEIPILRHGSEAIPSQTDDLDGDGQWEELAFAVSIRSGSAMKIKAGWVATDQAPAFERKTQVYLAEKQPDGSYREVNEAVAPKGLYGFPSRYQAEGVGWENDRMAFRIYFDCRNTKDLFGKRLPGLILQQAGNGPGGDYHTLAPWGMDILHCGSSLGAGGLALVENDSLIRLGLVPDYQYRQLADGPVRSIFELTYRGWEVSGQQLAAAERITLWAGGYGFRSEVTVSEFAGVKQLATGIVTSKLSEEPIAFQANDSYSVLMTHGRQSLNNDTLAMAVLARTDAVTRTGRTSDIDYYKLGYQDVPEKSFSRVISETCYLSQRIQSGIPSVHYFFAFWGMENPAWNNADNVKAYLRAEAEMIAHPLVIE